MLPSRDAVLSLGASPRPVAEGRRGRRQGTVLAVKPPGGDVPLYIDNWEDCSDDGLATNAESYGCRASEQRAASRRALTALRARVSLSVLSPFYRASCSTVPNGSSPSRSRPSTTCAGSRSTSKLDLLPTDDDPQRFKQFILQPTRPTLKRAWPLKKKLPLLWQKVDTGRGVGEATRVRDEFAPCFMTFTTGRSAEPVPFFYSPHDIQNLHDDRPRGSSTSWTSTPSTASRTSFPYRAAPRVLAGRSSPARRRA